MKKNSDSVKYEQLPFGCPFDGSLCDQIPDGGCVVYDKPKGGKVVWVCPRFDADFMDVLVKELGKRGSSRITVFKGGY